MKISQEVRDFAKTERALGNLAPAASAADAEKGMAEMSQKFVDAGSEIYHKVG